MATSDEHSLYTEAGQLIGTPEYVSPEQAEMTNLDIDTRSDVYSQPKELRQAGLAGIQKTMKALEKDRTRRYETASVGVLLYELLVGVPAS